MPVTHEPITVRPPAGHTLSVELLDQETGATVTAYNSQTGDGVNDLCSWPKSIPSETPLWVPTDGRKYNLSAKIGAVEIAAGNGKLAYGVRAGDTIAPVFDGDVLGAVIAASAGGSSAEAVRIELQNTSIFDPVVATAPLTTDPIVRSLTAVGITLGAAGFFAVQVTNNGASDIVVEGPSSPAESQLFVANGDGSQVIEVATASPLTIPAGQTRLVAFDGGSFGGTGSDLTQNGASTHLLSTAGGTFTATAVICIRKAA